MSINCYCGGKKSKVLVSLCCNGRLPLGGSATAWLQIGARKECLWRERVFDKDRKSDGEKYKGGLVRKNVGKVIQIKVKEIKKDIDKWKISWVVWEDLTSKIFSSLSASWRDAGFLLFSPLFHYEWKNEKSRLGRSSTFDSYKNI